MDKIEVLLIPFGDNAVIIPKEIVEYILPYAPPLPFQHTHEAVIGSLIYQSERAPVIDLSKYEPVFYTQEAFGKKRYIIVSSVSEQSRYNSYALLSLVPPRMLTLDKSMIEDLQVEKGGPFYGKIKYGNEYAYQYAYVLDFEKFEQTLLTD